MMGSWSVTSQTVVTNEETGRENSKEGVSED